MLTFYFRPGCHLCDDMWQQLLERQRESGFQLQAVDVDNSPELQSRFGTLVPVLASGKGIICNYYLDPIALNAFLQQEIQSA